MQIEFASQDLAELCLSERRAVRELGKPCAKKLFARLADLAAADRVADLVTGHPHPLRGDRSGQFSLRLEGAKRLVFGPANEPIPANDDGSIDWPRVTRVRIEFVGDYHD
jgi:proteic killer suppression protein